ncbi:MAG: DMT family transporter [Pseudomonadota bacterium]
MKGIVMTVVGIGCVTLNDALMKLVVDDVPVSQAIGLRGLFALLPVLFMTFRAGGLYALRVHSVAAHVGAAVLLAAPIFVYIYSLTVLPLSIATIIFFTNPLFVAVLAPLVLRERLGRGRVAAVLLGFAGAALVVNPTGAQFSVVLMLPLLVALLSGLREIVIRGSIHNETSVALMFYSTTLVAVLGLAAGAFVWVPMSGEDLLILALAAIAFTGGIYFMTEGLRYGDASLMAVFKYSGIVWSLLLGFALWGEVPSALTWVGTALIVVSGVYTVLRHASAAPDPTRP